LEGSVGKVDKLDKDTEDKSKAGEPDTDYSFADVMLFIVSMLLLLTVSIVDGIIKGIGRVFDLIDDDSENFNW
jgi:hypothetical protein